MFSRNISTVSVIPGLSFQLLLIFVPFFPQAVQAQEEENTSHKITLGSYFSKGDYGAVEETSINYFPVSYEIARFPWVLSVTTPFLALKGPGDVFLETGNIGREREGGDDFINETGVGDVFLSATYQFPPIFDDWVFVDFTIQAKIPTADENKDLGTGEPDFGYQLDFYTTLERNTYFSTFGYRQRGKTALFDLENSLYGSFGYMRQFGEKTYLGLIYDYRAKASSNSFESHEVMPFVSYNLGQQWNVMLYSIMGFTDSSADTAFGLQASYTFP